MPAVKEAPAAVVEEEEQMKSVRLPPQEEKVETVYQIVLPGVPLHMPAVEEAHQKALEATAQAAQAAAVVVETPELQVQMDLAAAVVVEVTYQMKGRLEDTEVPGLSSSATIRPFKHR
jgi:replicative superfamily II helicase